MPELPEVETVKNGLKKKVKGRRILSCRVLWPGIIAYPDKETCIKHLDMILAGKNSFEDDEMAEKYKNQFYERYTNGFLDFIENKKFEEKLGEYYESEGSTSTQIKKRIITYQEVQ